MEVLIRDCPHCGQLLMDDSGVCPECGKGSSAPVPVPARDQPAENLHTPSLACPSCGVDVPRGVLRCRDCGAYLSEGIAAAARSRGVEINPEVRGKSPSRGVSSLDKYEDVDVLDEEESSPPPGDDDDFATDSPMAASEDDFEYTDYAAGQVGEYALADQTPAAQDEYAPPQMEYLPEESPPLEGVPEMEPQEAAPELAEAAPEPAQAVRHPVGTAGDPLLDAALQEETESQKRKARGGRRTRSSKDVLPGSFIVFCPQGCRIVVQDKHRGRTGRCPKCKSLFFVPPAPMAEAKGVADPAEAAAPPPSSQYTWIQDVRLHRVNPAKLKIKPDSLLNEYDSADLGLHSEHVLLVTVYAGGGMLRAFDEPKKKPAVRQKVLDHLATAGKPDGLPAPKHSVLAAEQLSALKIVQPPVPGEESLFADVPVFGSGRIAVRVAAADTATEKAYLSFSLSQFRTFAERLGEQFGLTQLADAARSAGVPLTDETIEYACHYSETRMHVLTETKYQQADPAMPLVLLGWKCGGCGLIVSEDTRKKEKIGGKSEGSVPKAKCPKCKKPMGNNRLMGLKR